MYVHILDFCTQLYFISKNLYKKHKFLFIKNKSSTSLFSYVMYVLYFIFLSYDFDFICVCCRIYAFENCHKRAMYVIKMSKLVARVPRQDAISIKVSRMTGSRAPKSIVMTCVIAPSVDMLQRQRVVNNCDDSLYVESQKTIDSMSFYYRFFDSSITSSTKIFYETFVPSLSFHAIYC